MRYLAEIADEIAMYNRLADEQAELASQLYQVIGTSQIVKKTENTGQEKNESALAIIEEAAMDINKKLLPLSKKLIDEWEDLKSSYQKDFFEYDVRGKIIKQPLIF